MKLKKLSFLIVLGLMISLSAQSQKAGFVNVQIVLKKIPEYQSAQEKLNELAKQYKEEIKTIKREIATLYSSYQADKILLSAEMREKKLAEIKKKEDELELMKAKRFGENGDLFKERQKLVKPIQDKVYKAIQEIAEKKGFGMMLDVSSDISILYYNEKYNKTQDVIKKLGY